MTLRCPGAPSYGPRSTDAVVHAGSCCAVFALMSPERRQRVGLKYPAMPEPLLAVTEQDDEPITVGELIETVRLLQLADDLGEPAPVSRTPTVLVEHDYPQELLDALLDLGRPLGLDARCIRQPAP